MADELTPEGLHERARSFDRAADVYERARPGYPADAVDWLLESGPRTVLDLGAGTGKLTRVLTGRSGVERVVAVDPSEGMLRQLRSAVPSADARLGSAEDIPLDDDSVDAVVVAQAWHWVDPDRAEPEVARVLRPGGTLGLIWNARDDRVDWVARMSEIIHEGRSAELRESPPELRPPFTPVEFFETAWVDEVGRDELLELVASRSGFIVQDAASRQRILAALAHLLDTHPQLAALERIPVPYRTLAFRSSLG